MTSCGCVKFFAVFALSSMADTSCANVYEPVKADMLASEVVDNAEKANSIYPSDETRKELRKQHLLESRAALMALDVHLAHCYDLMMLNPAGCFTKSNGDNVGSSDAKKKLEHMSQELGELIDAENTMLTNVLKSDKGR